MDVDAERAEKSLRSYIKAMGRAAYARAIESGDAGDDDDDGPDLEEVASDYWDGDFRALLLSAYYLIDSSIREEMHDLLEHSGGLFRRVFTGRPDVGSDEADDEYLADFTIFDGETDHPGPVNPDPGVEDRASNDDIDDLVA